MKKIKYEEHLKDLGLCECLSPVLEFELNQGNQINSFDLKSDWPKHGSHLIYLKKQLHLKHPGFPFHTNIEAKQDYNIQYNWKCYAYCLIHHHIIIK